MSGSPAGLSSHCETWRGLGVGRSDFPPWPGPCSASSAASRSSSGAPGSTLSSDSSHHASVWGSSTPGRNLEAIRSSLSTICSRLKTRDWIGSCNYFPYLEAVLPFHLALWGMWADPLSHACHQVAHSLWGGQDIEGRWQGTLVIKVAKPQFGPSKLPLLILVILQRSWLKTEQCSS